ncbi:reverse transcriptase domain-containing protein [Planctomicrobium sp. SH527]|uniref:reverse transcriptase domain-containing protein n=1 Tax=Planctomicrobium sp. SH527 TaxID=3448123 RepID=UPI003F5BCCC7
MMNSEGYFERPNRFALRPEGQRYWLLRRQRRLREKLLESQQITLEDIANRDLLYRAYKYLDENCGHAPGLDGICYGDLAPSEMGFICGKLASVLKDLTYRPQPTRKVILQKRDGGQRVLKLGVILDRIVGRALYEVLGHVWDQIFLENSYGFRQGKNTFNLLARFLHEMQTEGRWIVAVADVQQAFDNVHQDDLKKLQEDAAAQLSSNSSSELITIDGGVLKLAMILIQGAESWRECGIDQGGNYSPVALNLIMHYAHDLLLQAEGLRLWYRYADNLVYLVQSVTDGRQCLVRVDERLRSYGLQLKANQDVTDLNERGTEIQILGFGIRRSSAGEPVIRFGLHAWKTLEEKLHEAHGADAPDQAALGLITGWIDAYGPAMQQRERVATKILNYLASYGFREISRDTVRGKIDGSRKRWDTLFRKTIRLLQR